MNRRSFVKGAAVGATALVLAGHDASSVAAQPLRTKINQLAMSSLHSVRHNREEAKGSGGDELGSKLRPYTNTPELEESYRLYQPSHSMAFMVTYMVANVMDNEGHKYNLFREYKGFDTLNMVANRSIPDGVTLAQPLFQPGETYLGKANNDMVDDQTFKVQPYLADPNLFSVVRGAQWAKWRDLSGRFELEYQALGPALEYYCPGRAEDTMYRSEPYSITGTLDGKDVHGYGVIDTSWGTPGIAWEQSKIFRYLEEVWLVWCNVFEDGTKECGVFMDGVDKFGCGYFNRNGETMVAGQKKSEILWTPDGFLQGANFAVGDLPFVFTMDARIVAVPNFLNWASGSVRIAGDTRTPVESYAWLEFLPKR